MKNYRLFFFFLITFDKQYTGKYLGEESLINCIFLFNLMIFLNYLFLSLHFLIIYHLGSNCKLFFKYFVHFPLLLIRLIISSFIIFL